MSSTSVIIRNFGLVPYEPIYQKMQNFTCKRHSAILDEIWILQHLPVYTLGQAGQTKHLVNTGNIPVYDIDRGGQVTYHGPGQLIVYLLMDIKRNKWGVKQFVHKLEQTVIDYLANQEIVGERRLNAPGIYVNECKIAALGFKIHRGCTYHGLSLNVNMDLTPFKGINPCGCEGLQVTQLRDLGIVENVSQVIVRYLPYLLNQFNLRAVS